MANPFDQFDTVNPFDQFDNGKSLPSTGAGGGRGSVNPPKGANEFARGNASRGPAKGIIAAAQAPAQDDSLYDPTGTIPQEVVNQDAPRESVLQGLQIPAQDPLADPRLEKRAFAEHGKYDEAKTWDGKSGRIIAPEPDADVNPDRVDKTLNDISQSFASGARHVGRQFGQFADLAGSALDPTLSAQDRANIARDYQQSRIADQQDYAPQTAVGTTVNALTNMAPMFIPGVGTEIGAVQMGMGAMQGAAEEGDSNANIYAKGVANMALGGTMGHLASGSVSNLFGRLPFLDKALAPVATDTLASLSRSAIAKGTATGLGFWGAMHGSDAAIDAATGDQQGKTAADYFGHMNAAADIAPMIVMSLVHAIPSYRDRNVMGQDSNAFTTTENGVSKVYLGHSDGTLFSSPDAAKSAYDANPDLFSSAPQVRPITEQAVNPKATTNKLLGYALDVTSTIQDAAEASAHATLTASRNAAIFQRQKASKPSVLEAPDVDTAIEVAQTGLSSVDSLQQQSATPIPAMSGLKSQMDAIRSVDPAAAEARERDELSALQQKSEGFTDEQGNVVAPTPLDVNENRRFQELSAKYAPPESTPTYYKTEDEALAAAKEQGVDQTTVPVQTGEGFILAPQSEKETVGDIRKNAVAVSDLGDALQTTDKPELITSRVLHDGEADPSRRASIQRASDSVGLISAITQTAFGWKPIPIRGVADYGLAYRGNAFVNIDAIAGDAKHDVSTLAVYTIGHEGTHVLERSKDAQDQADYQAFKRVVLQYTKDGALKARTAKESAFPNAKERGEGEVVADASGQMWQDHKFWQRMYELDNGSTMRRIAYRFMQAATKFMEAAKGTRQDPNMLFKGDTAEQIQESVQAVREAAAQVWSKQAMRKGRDVGRTKAKSELFDQEPPQMARKGVIAEVAPHPGDPVLLKNKDERAIVDDFGSNVKKPAGKLSEPEREMRDRNDLSRHWDSMSAQEKASATRGIGRKVLDQAQHITGQKGWDIEFSSGTFEGKSNPNMLLHAPEHATAEDIHEMTKVVGHMLDQKAMVSYDEGNTTGENQATFVKVDLPKGFTADKIEALREHLRQHGFDGDTLRDGGLHFGNFTGYTDHPVSDEDFHAGIDAALGKFDSADTFGTSRKRFESGYLEPENREAYLEGTHYGNSDTTRASTGGDVLRRRQGRDTLERVGQELQAQRKQWTDNSPAGRADADERARARAAASAGSFQTEYGRGIEGSDAAVGVHFSQQDRSHLNSEYYGRGVKGLESQRLEGRQNDDIRPRIFFYVDKGNGVVPEAGVGGKRHAVKLNNLYDVQKDRLGLARDSRGDYNAFERSVKNAGFDGYLNDNGGNQKFAVLIGKHVVSMDEAPQHARFDKDEDRLNHLGNFDLDFTGDEYKLTDEEIEAKIKAELAKEQGIKDAKQPIPKSAKTVDFAQTKDSDIKKAGLHPEDVYPKMEYQPHTNGGQFARFKVNGNDYVANVKDKVSPNLTSNISGSDPIREMNPDSRGRALPYEMGGMSEAAKKAWNQRFAASADLLRRRFDLYTAVPKDARERVAEVWNQIAKNPDAFEFGGSPTPKGKNVVEVAQSIADQMLDGNRYQVKAMPLGPDERAFYGDGVKLKVTDTKTNQTSIAHIEFDRHEREVVMHTQDLEKGSGAGKPVYQIGQQFAAAFGAKIHADPQGLLGVNNYRRTEQMFSGMLRSGKPDTMQPGIGQRIYGWNERAKTDEHHERNMVRTALAIARNVSEMFPQISDLRYDMKTGQFLHNDGTSAEGIVKGVLASPDARAMSLSRSTLARAAITHEAIAGKVDVPEKVQEPVLYARKDEKLEQWVGDISRGRKTDPGYVVSEEPHQALQMFGVGRSAPVVLQANMIRHLANKDRLNNGITASDISKIPDMLRNPRAVIDRTSTPSGDFAVVGNDRDADGNPLLIGIKKGQLVMGRTSINVTDVRTLFGKSESLSFVLRNIKDGNRVWMPKEEVARVRDFTDEGPIPYGTDGAAPPQTSSVPNTPSSDPRSQTGLKVSQATRPNVYSDRALVKSKQGGKEWTLLREPMHISDADVKRAEGVAFARKESDDQAEQVGEQTPSKSIGARLDSIKSHVSDVLDSYLDPVYKTVAPMSSGADKTRAVAQDWINQQRRANWEWGRLDNLLTKNFTVEQRAKMWDAADEQNELLATGQDTTGKGLDRLNPEERAAVEQLHSYGEELLQRAKDVGLFKGEGVPYWTPRMMALINDEGDYVKPSAGQTASSSGRGRNFTSTSSSLKQRKYLSSVDTEEAMMHKGGVLVHDIRTMPLAMGKLEKAIAGRELINQIKELGKSAGTDMVSDSKQPGFFTIDHPSFTTFRPRLEEKDGVYQAVKDEDGNVIMEKHPLYIHSDFEGPLKAILSEKNGPIYQGYMLLKSKAMSAIMFSPLIHAQVILGRALAYGGVRLPTIYWRGRTAKKDPEFMRKMVDSGMVPIGEHSNMLDVGDLARDQSGAIFEPSVREKLMDPNESWIGLGGQKVLNYLPGDLKLGDKFKSGFDATGDFWHNTLLWRRVGDLQAGIAQDVYGKLLKQGVSEQDAATVAAHIANRYAGAIGRENMSQAMHKFANILLFSKSFNMGNIGTVKDAFYGLPAGLRAQMFERGDKESMQKAMNFATSKARWGLVTDLAATILLTSLVQNMFKEDKRGYMGRAMDMLEQIKQHPADATSYNPYRLSATWNNEPDKRDRVDMGAQPNSGRHEYMRLPTGKVVEDTIGWLMHPADTLQKKLSPLASSVEGVAQNAKDKYGTPIRNPDGPVLQKAWDVAKYFVGKEMPLDQMNTVIDIMNGKATQLDRHKALGNVSGFTVSQGNPRGPEGAVAQATEDRMTTSKRYSMEAVKSDLKYGREEKAYQRLIDTGMTPREANRIINNLENPRSTLSAQQRKKFNAHATEEDRADMEAVQ